MPRASAASDLEAAGPAVLPERVADRAGSVGDRERLDAVPVPLDRVPRGELLHRERIREPPDDDAQRLEERARPARAVDGDAGLAAAEREGLEHPRQAEDVVGVQVGEEDVLEVAEPGVGAQQLSLRPLAAVDEEPVAAAADQRRGRAARGRRRRARGAQEDEVEVHGRGS